MEIAIFCTFGSEAEISHVDFRRYEEARNVWGQKIFSPEVTLAPPPPRITALGNDINCFSLISKWMNEYFNLRLTLEFP